MGRYVSGSLPQQLIINANALAHNLGLVNGNDKKALHWSAEDEEPVSPINDTGADRAFTGGRRV